MKSTVLTFVALAAAANLCAAVEIIPIETDATALVYTVGDDGRLYQSYFGERLDDAAEYASPKGKRPT